jgi:hypothetical protein
VNAANGAGETEHKISMVVETYVYSGANKNKNVNIPNYASKRDRLRDRIVANALSIKLRKFEYRGAQGRRDVFVDPRQSAASVAAGSNPLEVQKGRIDRFAAEVQALREVFQRARDERLTYLERAKLEKTLREKLGEIQAGIADVTERQLITWPPYQLKWNNEVLQPLADVQREISQSSELVRDQFLAKEQLQQLLELLTEEMKQGNLDAVRERYATVQDKLGVDAEDERYPLVERIEMIMLCAETITEFSNLRLEIDGVVVNQEGRSGILVNGQVVEEGEYLSDDLVLKAVAAESAEFVYKGFVVVKSW